MIDIIDLWPIAPVAQGRSAWFELFGAAGQRIAAATLCVVGAGLAVYAARRVRDKP